MINFQYIDAWSFPLTPIITFIIGLVLFVSLLGLGNYTLTKSGSNIKEPWLSTVSIVFGILLFSLAVQIISILEVANTWILISLIFLILPFGLKLLLKKSFLVNNLLLKL